MVACGEVGVKAWLEDEGLGVGGESETGSQGRRVREKSCIEKKKRRRKKRIKE